MMNEKTGEIRKYDEGMKADRAWSEPFREGEVVILKGIRMKIVKIKQLRGQLVLEARD